MKSNHFDEKNTYKPFTSSNVQKVLFILLFIYFIYAFSQLGFNYDRFKIGLSNGAEFLGRMFPPTIDQPRALWQGMIESLQIALLASFLGILIAIPIGLLGARNLMPAWVSWPARFIVVFCRSLHPVIVAILFVKAVGFGALAGILALAVASIGFIGKLITESIEEISLKQVEAVRATGASFMNVIIFAVIPQVFGRFIGFATYQFDSNLRNSTMVGIVGAGGIGGTLFSAFQRFDYSFVSAILITLVITIMIGEVLARIIRVILLENRSVIGFVRKIIGLSTEQGECHEKR
ncbi:phosphonate ABC transporter, permease protein PhnE [Ignatzschineria sp. LJL83]